MLLMLYFQRQYELGRELIRNAEALLIDAIGTLMLSNDNFGQIRDGSYELISHNKSKRKKIAIQSDSLTETQLERLAKDHNLFQFIDAYFSSRYVDREEMFPIKNYPKMASDLGADSARSVVIGDIYSEKLSIDRHGLPFFEVPLWLPEDVVLRTIKKMGIELEKRLLRDREIDSINEIINRDKGSLTEQDLLKINNLLYGYFFNFKELIS